MGASTACRGCPPAVFVPSNGVAQQRHAQTSSALSNPCLGECAWPSIATGRTAADCDYYHVQEPTVIISSPEEGNALGQLDGNSMSEKKREKKKNGWVIKCRYLVYVERQAAKTFHPLGNPHSPKQAKQKQRCNACKCPTLPLSGSMSLPFASGEERRRKHTNLSRCRCWGNRFHKDCRALQSENKRYVDLGYES